MTQEPISFKSPNGQRGCTISEAQGGFIDPLRFEGDKPVYVKRSYAQGAEQEFEVAFTTLEGWKPI